MVHWGHGLEDYYSAVSLVATDAIVLHAFDYRESSRIFRLATREFGVRSAIARGARRSKQRFSAALDLFAEGSAHIVLHPTGDLHTLSSFDVARARPALAERWERFTAASALSEMVLRFARDDTQPALYESVRAALDTLSVSDGDDIADAGLAGAWALVAHLGFAPALDVCANCGAPLARGETVRFAHRAGGVLCARCAGQTPGSRALPPDARASIAAWIAGNAGPTPDARAAKAHLRLLREFLQEHVGDDRALRAFAVWEQHDWAAHRGEALST
jgi:DNA repair protein RecO (recombination protein O)